MKVQLSLLVAACCWMSSVWMLTTDNGAIGDRSLDEEWQMYKNFFNKKYGLQMETVRRLIWEDNLQYIQQHNLEADMGKHSHRLGMNHFGDLTHEEFKSTMLGYKPPSRNGTTRHMYLRPLNSNSLPDKVDWRKPGYVTPVKNQGQCGSCWSFSATGALEGQWFRKTGKLISLSEKQLMDCSYSYGNNACEGGLMDRAFQYIEKYGSQSDESYPYAPVDGNCKYAASKVVASCKGYTDVERGNELDLQSAVAFQGPVSVAIDASHLSFQFYQSGIYNEPRCSTTRLDHGVLVVGYADGYWLVKNSWGPHWGEAGYIQMPRNKDNQCGIASMASYPLV